MPAAGMELFSSSYADLNEGARIPIVRLRQLLKVLQEDCETELWPLTLVNVATCVEWFARTILKHLIDYSADRLNPDARIFKELKINYAVVVQAHSQQFSIGDIVATSRNFSSFDEISATFDDLTKEVRPHLLARVQRSWTDLVDDVTRQRGLPKKAIARELNTMFRKRNEIVHGTPRHLAYSDQLDAFLTKEELLRFIRCALQYMRLVETTLKRFLPESYARSTRDMNINQGARLRNSDNAIERLEKAIERRLSGDPEHVAEFRKAQRAWRLWRRRESLFQTGDWRGGTGRRAILMGYETSFNMERLRSLEAYVRQLDRYAAALKP